jgi:polysaccharide export outer membrane protein
MIKKIFILFCACLASSAFAQFGSPDAAQILQGMEPANRERLLGELGIGTDQSTGSQTANDQYSDRNSRRIDVRRDVSMEGSSNARQRESRIAPGSVVLITIDYIGDKPERVQDRGEGLPPSILPAERAPNYSGGEKQRFDLLISSIRSRNPYTIDDSGNLQLPGLPLILLSGLSEQQATARLAADPLLTKLDVSVTIVPVDKTGTARLKPFGHDFFENYSADFGVASNASVPQGYELGSGDTLLVQLFGSQNRMYRLAIDREGKINFPEIGPIQILGKSFEVARDEIEQRVSSQLIGARASVSIAEARSIQVFLAGDVKNPGTYTISGLSTVLGALYVAGGVSERGSLRNIQVKRGNAAVGRLDLYDLLLRGDSAGDLTLRAGDVVFVPPVTSTIAVDGSIRRPGIYELKAPLSVQSVIALAGGLLADADDRRVTVVEYDEQRQRVATQVSALEADFSRRLFGNGAEVFIPKVRSELNAGVSVSGHVFRTGVRAWREGLRLSDLISSFDDLRPGADPHYIVIQRELPESSRIEVLSADLQQALLARGGPNDLMLAPRDKILVFDADAPRADLLQPIFATLRRQATFGEPTEIVTVVGRVLHPGEYPLENKMRVSDLIRAGGRLRDNAFPRKVEVTRFLTDGGSRRSELLEVDLSAIFAGDVSADIELKPFDILTVKELPEWSRQEFITLSGEVRFPGRYPIRRGETLRSVLERAGGLSALAYPRGAVFTRQALQDRESRQIASLTEELTRQAMSRSLQMSQLADGAQALNTASTTQALLAQLQSTKAVGRLVIDLDKVIESGVGSRADLLLNDGDALVVPSIPQEVTVLGEVRNVTSHLFRTGLTKDDYISLSGGFTNRADKRGVYVIRADGSVVGSSASWFQPSDRYVIQPGDTVIAPMDIGKLPPLPLWQAVTSILYNTAVAIAAVGSLK